MARASTSYKSGSSSKPAAKAVPVSKGAAASGNRYQAAYDQSRAPTTAAPQWLQRANQNANARAAQADRIQTAAKSIGGAAGVLGKNQPKPQPLKALAFPTATAGSTIQSFGQQAANQLYGNIANPPNYQTPQGANILANAQDLQNNFIPPTPPPAQPLTPGFNQAAPPTNTVMPDTYAGQVQRIIERAMASGRTLPDTIQGMLDRLGQQYAPQRPSLHGTVQTMLPDTEEGALNRILEQMSGLPLDTGGNTGGTDWGYGGGNGGGGGPSAADIMRWLYGNVYWRGWGG